MSGYSDYAAKNALNYITGQIQTALPPVWLALFTVPPTDAGTGGTEVSGGAYARVQIAGSVALSSATSSGTNILNFSAVPAWVSTGMSAHNLSAPASFPAGLTVTAKTATTVTLSANVTSTTGAADSIAFSAFTEATASAPSQAVNGATIAFPQATTAWGTALAFGLYDAAAAGNLLLWDYLFNGSWLPCTVSAASPGVLTVKAHGYLAADPVIFSTEYGGTAPSFSQSNFTGVLTVTGPAADSFSVTNAGTAVNTSGTGSGSVRKILQQSIPINATFTISPNNAIITAA